MLEGAARSDCCDHSVVMTIEAVLFLDEILEREDERCMAHSVNRIEGREGRKMRERLRRGL